ncbi:MAG: hypothetical protein IJ437_04495 [Clostridia bacterium]|nr:hypothetical protein [Clostridia bacterium]
MSKQKKKFKKYTIQEKRSFWTGYGIALERMQSERLGMSYGEKHLSSGWVPSISSAEEGYNRAMKNRGNDYKLSHPFYPEEKL